MSLTELFIFWLAVFGVSITVSQLHGPFGLCSRLRQFIWAKTKSEWIRDGIYCPICVSFWASIPLAVLVSPHLTVIEFIGVWFSGVGFTAAVKYLSPPGDPDGGA
jgi:hypothetical protein